MSKAGNRIISYRIRYTDPETKKTVTEHGTASRVTVIENEEVIFEFSTERSPFGFGFDSQHFSVDDVKELYLNGKRVNLYGDSKHE